MALDFDRDGYREILVAAVAADYRVMCMQEAVKTRRGRVLMLRHDVDFSLEYALEMARFEQALGFHATYFLLLHNDYYNPLSPGGRRAVEQLVGMGHEVGLHWDSSVYPADAAAMRDHFMRDLETLAEIARRPILSASQHIPADSPLLDVSALVTNEAYSRRIRDRFAYVSDSAMKWRAATPLDLVKRRVDIQFLAHPIWWFASGLTREEKLRNLPMDCHDRVSRHCEAFISYMNGVLEDRERYDRRFRKLHGLDR